MFGIEVFQREDGKDARTGFDGKEIYKCPHICVESHSHSLLDLRNRKKLHFMQKTMRQVFFPHTFKALPLGKRLSIPRMLHSDLHV